MATHHCIVQLYFIRIKGGVLRADYAYLTTTHLIAIIFGIKYGHICCTVRDCMYISSQVNFLYWRIHLFSVSSHSGGQSLFESFLIYFQVHVDLYSVYTRSEVCNICPDRLVFTCPHCTTFSSCSLSTPPDE